MRKTLLVSIFAIACLSAFAQTDNTYYAKGFPGADVGTKVANAQAACIQGVQCYIVIDPTLVNFAAGTMPTKCATCNWIDYRTANPYGQPGPQGNTGPSGANGVASLPQLASVRSVQPGVPNLFNSATVTAGDYVSGTTGALVSNAGFSASAFIPANSGGSMVTSASISNGVAGYAFYDQNQAFISGSNSATSAGATITVPSTAAFVRISLANAAVNYEMIVNGTALPSSYVAFGTMDTYTDAFNNLAAQSLAIAAHAAAVNLFNASTVSTGALRTSGTVDSSISADSVSALIPVAGYSTLVSNLALSVAGGYAPGWFDINGNFVSAFSSTVSAGTSFSVPQYAAYLRVYWATTANGSAMVVPGSSLPPGYVPYSTPQYIMNQATAAAASFQNTLASARGSGFLNLYNYQSPTLTVGALRNNGTIDTSVTADVVSDFMPVAGLSAIITNLAVPCSGGYCSSWYDGSQNLLSNAGAFTAGTPVSPPTGAVYLRIYFTAYTSSGLGVPPLEIIAGSTLPQGFVPFASSAERYDVLTNGCKMGFWGDSITATYSQWQNTILRRTGCAKAFHDAVNGRGTANALSGTNGHYSNNTATGVNQGGNTGTTGNTLTQDLTGLNVMFIWEGTDDGGVAVGSSSSTAWDGTEYGNVKGLIETLQTANPSMRIVWVGPYYQVNASSGDPYNANIRAAILYQCQQHGIPFKDMVVDSGINAQNLAVTLQGDQIHPLAAYNNSSIGPMLANWLKGIL